MTPRLPPEFLMRPLAHRALHDKMDRRPENSRAAVWAAMVKGYGIEIDLQLSADGVAMVFHDYALDRLTHMKGPVAERTSTELADTRLAHSFEGIPTLRDVLDLVAGRVPILIEIKDQDGAMGSNVGPLEAATAEAIGTYEGPIAVMSFNPFSVACMAELAPNVPRGLTTCGYDPAEWPLSDATCAVLREIDDYEAVGATFLSHDVKDLDRARVTELKSKGADILCWTVKSPEAEAKARQIASNITFEGYLAEMSS